ncbi:unnamed protein product [marine sediment metagenome]|uniref:Uncharacterized protein n=1 Tax=marine sediment metagenome TaxID=412755 RepID=X0WUH6_9ZZZZ
MELVSVLRWVFTVMTALSDKLQELVSDFANGEADDTCQDAFNRLVEYAEELEAPIAMALMKPIECPYTDQGEGQTKAALEREGFTDVKVEIILDPNRGET